MRQWERDRIFDEIDKTEDELAGIRPSPSGPAPKPWPPELWKRVLIYAGALIYSGWVLGLVCTRWEL